MLPPSDQIVRVRLVNQHVDVSAASRSYFLGVDVLEALSVLLINPLESSEFCGDNPLHVLGVLWSVL